MLTGYRNAAPGDQGFGLGKWIWIGSPNLADFVSENPCGSVTLIWTVKSWRLLWISGVKTKVLFSQSVLEVTAVMCWIGTVSNQTVCQIPVTGVYQILLGTWTCLPLGCGPASDGSQTRTRIVCLSPLISSSEISKLNPSKPPWWLPARVPLTQTSASQSTAPKCKRVRLLVRFKDSVSCRSYQSSWSGPTVFCTPERRDSTAKGTVILPWKPASGAVPLGKIA